MARFELTTFEPGDMQITYPGNGSFAINRQLVRKEVVYPTLTEALTAFHTAAEARGLPPQYRDARNHPDYPAFYRFDKNFLAVADRDEKDARRGAIALRRIP